MKIANWIRPREASAAELRAQLEHAESAHTVAIAVVESAERVFDDVGDDASSKAVVRAIEAKDTAALHVQRAKRLLDAAVRRETEQRHEQLRQRCAELEAESRDHAVEKELADAEAQAVIAVADARLRRREHEIERRNRRDEIEAIRRELGEQVQPRTYIESVEPAAGVVRDRVHEYIATLSANDPRRVYLRGMVSL